jgi:LuxR family maltose regulon positive regulatory protein
MPTMPLLATKLHIPRVKSELVPRPRLTGRLDESLERKLTLVSAPAGFGKTTLLSEWAARCGRRKSQIRIAWVSLDEGDNDLKLFLSYLIAALQTVQANLGAGVLGLLQSPQFSQASPIATTSVAATTSPPMEPIMTALINEIVHGTKDLSIPSAGSGQDSEGCLILVLDDYHAIESQPVHDALAFLLEHLPSQMHLVVATRSDPPLDLARFRGRGQLTELRLADLRFSADEVTELFNQRMGLELSVDDVAALTSRTEGWIAGLQMAALALQSTVSPQGREAEHVASFIEAFTGSDRYILDYLVEEVLNRRPEATKDFLLQTSILDRLSGPLCDAVRFGPAKSPNRSEEAASSSRNAMRFGITESPSSSSGTAVRRASHDQRNGGVSSTSTTRNDSQAVLESLEAANLFIIPLDNERRWYRYHHLFADLLRVRLKAMHPDLAPILHQRAAAWHENHDHFAAAIHHYLEAADYQAVGQVIGKRYHAFIARGDYVTLRGWIESLPEEFVHSWPRISIAYAWSLLNETDADILDAPLQNTVRAIAGLPANKQHEDTALHGELTAIQAFQAFWRNDIRSSIELSQQALAQLSPEQPQVRGFVALNLANAYGVLGQLDAAIDTYEEVIAASRQSGNLAAALIALGYLGEFHALHGHLRQAARTHQRALRLSTGPDGSTNPMGGIAHVGLGMTHYEWNNLDKAIHHLEAGRELSQQAGILLMVTHSLTTLALINQAQGDAERARSLLEEAALQAPVLHKEGDYPRARAAMTRLAIALGDLDTVERWVRQSGISVHDEISPLYAAVYPYLGLARLLVAKGRNNATESHLREAAGLLARLLALAEETGRASQRIEVLILQALVLDAQGRAREALSPLQQALQLAEPEGYVRTFVDEGAPMEELLKRSKSSYKGALGLAEQRLQAYVNNLLGAFPDFRSRSSGTGLESVEGSEIVEPLSEHELRVLRLVAAGLSNREAADELYVSVNTVKWHLRNTYSKLNVRGRVEASARARELGLL